MPYSITILNTFLTTASIVRGFCFHAGKVWLASPGDAVLEEMNQVTGAVIADHPAGAAAWLSLFDPVAAQFWTPSAGAGASTVVSRFDSTGVLIDNPTVQLNPYGQCIANGSYWVANIGSDSASKLDAATGALVATVPGLPTGPSAGIGACIYDGASIWIPTINNTLYQIDEATATLVNTFTVAGVGRWSGMILANGFLWATDIFLLHLIKMDLFGNVLNLYPIVGSGPLAFDGANLWVMDVGGNIAVYSQAGNVLAFTATTAPNGQWIAGDGALPSGAYAGGTPNQMWATSGSLPGHLDQFLLVFTPPPAGAAAFPGTFAGFGTPGQFGGGTK